jgi:hypothetical protein
MAKRRYTAEEIVTVLRQVEVALANGKPTPQACREAGIAGQILSVILGVSEFERNLTISNPTVPAFSPRCEPGPCSPGTVAIFGCKAPKSPRISMT